MSARAAPEAGCLTFWGCLPQERSQVNYSALEIPREFCWEAFYRKGRMTRITTLGRRELIGVVAGVLGACKTADGQPESAFRVVSLSPSTTEAVFAVGAGERLVARSRFCDFPLKAKSLPSVGGFIDPSYEAILAQRPSLVIGARGPGGPDLVHRLRSLGIDTYFPPTRSIAEIEVMVKGVADALKVAAVGATVVRAMRKRKARIQELLAGRSRPRVLMVFGVRPIVVAGRGSFPQELLTLAGARNAVESTARYPTVGIERVLTMDPDLIIETTGASMGSAPQLSPSAPGWSSLGAVKAGKLRHITDPRVLRPGPRIVEGLEVLARAIHPELPAL